jgi:hypothetical protein
LLFPIARIYPAACCREDVNMPGDENEFFREATLHICGNLDIEQAMARFLQYLRRFMPADQLILERYDEGSGSVRSIVIATLGGVRRSDVAAPLSNDSKKMIKEMFREGVPEPYYENSPDESPATRELLAFFELKASALLGLPLSTGGHEPAGLVILAESGKYDDSHLRLMSPLRAPFQVALANTLQHAEIVELKDRLAVDNKVLLAQHTRTYLALRKAVGLIGILMPFTLMLGNFFIFKGELLLRSISRYYHSDMRNVFVAALCAMALFMFFYSGFDWRERWAAILAGVLTLGVAFFPTTLTGPTDLTGRLHYTFAVSLFLLLAWISIFHFPRKLPGVAKQVTDRIQVICGLLMITCVLSIILYYTFLRVEGKETCFVFVAETIALVAFGVSWFTEGLDLEKEIA